MRWLGQSEYRPLIFPDASFINKNATGGSTWAPSCEPEGNVVEDKNTGGAGRGGPCSTPYRIADMGMLVEERSYRDALYW